MYVDATLHKKDQQSSLQKPLKKQAVTHAAKTKLFFNFIPRESLETLDVIIFKIIFACRKVKKEILTKKKQYRSSVTNCTQSLTHSNYKS